MVIKAVSQGASVPSNVNIKNTTNKNTETKLNTTSLQNTQEDELQSVEINEGVAESENVGASAQISAAMDKAQSQYTEVEQKYQEKIQECLKQIDEMQNRLKEINNQRCTLASKLTDENVNISDFMDSFRDLDKQKKEIYDNIDTILSNITELEQGLSDAQIQTQDILNQLSALTGQTGALLDVQSTLGTTGNNVEIGKSTPLGDAIVALGNSFVGVINNDAQGNKEFSGGVSQAWCADFASSIVKRAYQATGKPIPAGFGSSSVSGLLSWGQSNGRFIETKGKSNKAQIIAKNVKPGDLIIQKENGASHTGIVTKVNPDGSFETVEGNSSDAVKNRSYTADSAVLTGFISMS